MPQIVPKKVDPVQNASSKVISCLTLTGLLFRSELTYALVKIGLLLLFYVTISPNISFKIGVLLQISSFPQNGVLVPQTPSE